MAGVTSSIQFVVGEQPVSTYTNFEGRVSGEPSLTDVDIPVGEFETNMRMLTSWRRYLRDSSVNAEFPLTPVISSGIYLDRVERMANGRVKYRLELGDLVFDATYKPNQQVYTITRTTFDLTWMDFQYFFLSLSRFWLRCARLEINGEP